MNDQKLATLTLHAGHDVTANGGTGAEPICQTTSYVFDGSNQTAISFTTLETK